jgi:hypothetical protein
MCDIYMYHRGMTDEDWTQVRIPVLMAKAIDQFLKTDIAKKNGVFSRNDFASRVIGGWFSQFEKEFDIFVPRGSVKDTEGHDMPKPFD